MKSPRRSTESLAVGARKGVATYDRLEAEGAIGSVYGVAVGPRSLALMRRLWFGLWYWMPRRPPWDTGITPPEVERFVASHPPGRAIDLGCGTGTNAVYLARHGWSAVGVDFAGRAIAKARRRTRDAGAPRTFFVWDGAAPEGPGPFGLALRSRGLL